MADEGERLGALSQTGWELRPGPQPSIPKPAAHSREEAKDGPEVAARRSRAEEPEPPERSGPCRAAGPARQGPPPSEGAAGAASGILGEEAPEEDALHATLRPRRAPGGQRKAQPSERKPRLPTCSCDSGTNPTFVGLTKNVEELF